MPADTLFTNVQHPSSQKYQADRRRQINECLKMSESELKQLYHHMKDQSPLRDDDSMVSKIMGEMYNMPFLPTATKSILDSTSGTGGNVLLRQDLEPCWKVGAFSQ